MYDFHLAYQFPLNPRTCLPCSSSVKAGGGVPLRALHFLRADGPTAVAEALARQPGRNATTLSLARTRYGSSSSAAPLARVSLGGNAAAEPADDVRPQLRRNWLRGTQKKRTAAARESYLAHKSCRSSASAIAGRIFSRNFFLCSPHDKSNRDAHHRTFAQSPDESARASSTPRSSLSRQTIAAQSNASRSRSKAR